MSIKNSLIGLILLAVVGGAGYLAYRKLVVPNRQCDICGRTVHAAMEAIVLRKDGAKVHNCCPRCAIHYELNHSGEVSSLLVTDRNNGEKIDGRRAFYVEGGDEQTCGPGMEMPPREPGVEYDRAFDRCLPTLVAFKDVSAAEAYHALHGGRILSYGQAVESVREK